MRDVFKETKDLVPAVEAARRLGLEFERENWCKCPFHQDGHASMSFKNGRWHCWVCNLDGDSIDLTARLLHLTPLQAVEHLNREFSLGLQIHGPPPTAEERAEIQRAQQERRDRAQAYETFEDWRADTLWRVQRCNQLALETMQSTKSPEEWDNFSETQNFAIKNMTYMELCEGMLQSDSPEYLLLVFKNRKEIALRTEKILSLSQTKSSAN